ncbi:unnamed protein product [Vicia faba]|uniref:Uncharacterized protein n=1 Tax=Vicia faba TaxID=3906 RepID=A0AAV1B6R3_VICFA|nr:unnamed protein product [Vicia faba]
MINFKHDKNAEGERGQTDDDVSRLARTREGDVSDAFCISDATVTEQLAAAVLICVCRCAVALEMKESRADGGYGEIGQREKKECGSGSLETKGNVCKAEYGFVKIDA